MRAFGWMTGRDAIDERAISHAVDIRLPAGIWLRPSRRVIHENRSPPSAMPAAHGYECGVNTT